MKNVPVPPIAPYPMPTESELPENLAPWRPHPARALLLIHDMQQYFVDPFTPGEAPLVQLLDNIRLLRARADSLGVPVAYTAQPGGMTRAQRGLLYDIWGPGMTSEPRHKRIIAELAPGERDTVLTRWRYSAFHRSGLRELLDRHGRDQLIICGVYAHVGCLMTACDAYTQDIQPFLPADALADLSGEEHRMALRYAARRCAVVLSTRNFLAELSRATAETV